MHGKLVLATGQETQFLSMQANSQEYLDVLMTWCSPQRWKIQKVKEEATRPL